MRECPHCAGIIDAGAAQPIADPVFDGAARCLVVDGKRRRPTPIQWRILLLLRERFRRCVPADFLAQASAGKPEDGGSLNSLKVHLSFLRRRLEGTPFAIATFHGQGYGLFWAHEVEGVPYGYGRRQIRRLVKSTEP